MCMYTWKKKILSEAVVRRCSVKKVFFENFAKFTEEQESLLL